MLSANEIMLSKNSLGNQILIVVCRSRCQPLRQFVQTFIFDRPGTEASCFRGWYVCCVVCMVYVWTAWNAVVALSVLVSLQLIILGLSVLCLVSFRSLIASTWTHLYPYARKNLKYVRSSETHDCEILENQVNLNKWVSNKTQIQYLSSCLCLFVSTFMGQSSNWMVNSVARLTGKNIDRLVFTYGCGAYIVGYISSSYFPVYKWGCCVQWSYIIFSPRLQNVTMVSVTHHKI